MSSKDGKTVKTIAKAMEILPDSKCEYLLGYAEGVIAALAEKSIQTSDPPEKDSA